MKMEGRKEGRKEKGMKNEKEKRKKEKASFFLLSSFFFFNEKRTRIIRAKV